MSVRMQTGMAARVARQAMTGPRTQMRAFADNAGRGDAQSPYRRRAAITGAAVAIGAFGSYMYSSSARAAGVAKAGPGGFSTSSSEPALNSDEFRNFKLVAREDHNHNVAYYTFALPSGTDSGLEVASALVTRSVPTEGDKALLDDNGKPVIRPYTPVTAPDVQGELKLMIKRYPNGKMSNYINELKIGEELAIKGPIKKFPWKANQFKEVFLIAGGSGITPQWQILQHIASNPDDKTKAHVIFSNVSEADILLKDEFQNIERKNPDQFKVTFVLDKPSPQWSGETGYIDKNLLAKYLPSGQEAGDNVHVFVCGPPPQVAAIAGKKEGMKQGELSGALKELGYTSEQVFKF